MKRRVFVVMVLLFAVPFFCFAAGSAEKSKSDEKIVRVVTTGSFYPHIFTDKNGNLTGFEYDVIEEIAKRIGYKAEWQLASEGLYGYIDSGRADTIANSVTVTEKRRQTYDFTEIYLYDEIRMVVRSDDPAKSVDDLQGRKVCIEYGGVLQQFFDNYNKNLPDDKKIKTVVTEGSLLENLELGRFDAFPLSILSFDRIKERGQYNFKMVGESIIISPSAYPFSKNADPKLVEAFSKTIKEMHKDGTLSALSQKYFKQEATKAK
ncbi:transporter substrate-binding domain-containing protein [Treponema denticola]|uniref:Solute-binding protein family 3/N-terminal domain-containing protein n=1 Tax=Treponema denticola SP33 TaxID=999437 RepID=M2BT47_TREDN|nr:transporter substrate-binding domain-containing protein [Treponema denticola]EMB25204.1 hypothetical protein HMPREF9733_01266 [Treponema denticola SP33]EPF36607.1 hypothetical protein HMPREF9732_00631 [Treponema denticola SP32]